LFGLAVGDALGTTIEFSRRDSYEPVTGQIAGAVWGYSSIPAHWRYPSGVTRLAENEVRAMLRS
jgi:ADP-ribosylglycohydrolase